MPVPAPAPAEGGAEGPAPIEKLAPWATAWEGLLPVLCMYRYTLLERSYSTRTAIKRINFSRRFDKAKLNFQKVLYIG